MTPSARVEITKPARGGFRSGVLYPELPALMAELARNGKKATAYDVATGEIVGAAGIADPDRQWWARDRPPLPPLRDARA